MNDQHRLCRECRTKCDLKPVKACPSPLVILVVETFLTNWLWRVAVEKAFWFFNLNCESAWCADNESQNETVNNRVKSVMFIGNETILLEAPTGARFQSKEGESQTGATTTLALPSLILALVLWFLVAGMAVPWLLSRTLPYCSKGGAKS